MTVVSARAAAPSPAPTPPEATPGSIMIRLAARPDMASIERMPRGAERKAAAWSALSATAETSQKPLLELATKLKESGAVTGWETLVSPNMLIVDPVSGKSNEVLKAFGAAAGVKTIYSVAGNVLWPASVADAGHGSTGLAPGQPWGLDLSSRGAAEDEPQVPYGINMVGAPEAWKLGATGKGLVYGSIDTGADYTHEAINAAYRGRNADGTYSHDYSWMDFSPKKSQVPIDPDAHGTHTIGTVLGKAPTANIGVAPEAQWISALGLTGQADVRLKALQWMLAPTRLDGTAPDATRAPDVLGMSWWTASPQQDLFHDSIRNLSSAGIEVVKSAGNKGPAPETISSPGQFSEINAVAAVDSTGQIADFSSRGPSPLPHGMVTKPIYKPDFSAPGVDVLSSVPGNKYAKYSGTSMAQPHFSGVVLALLSKYPQLTHSQINSILSSTSTDVGARGRDLEFGYGIVNLPSALAAADKLVNKKPPATTR